MPVNSVSGPAPTGRDFVKCRGCGGKGRAVVSIRWQGAGRLDQASGSSLRRKIGAGFGTTLEAAPHLDWPGRIVNSKARRCYAAAVNEMSAARPHHLSCSEAADGRHSRPLWRSPGWN